MTIKAIIVTNHARSAKIIEAESEVELIDKFAALGIPLTGRTSAAGPLREELRSAPKFGGLHGPMWGGDETPLRYESSETYELLSN